MPRRWPGPWYEISQFQEGPFLDGGTNMIEFTRLLTRLALWWLLPLLSAGTMAQGYLKEFSSRQQTKYFEFHYKRNPEQIAAI